MFLYQQIGYPLTHRRRTFEYCYTTCIYESDSTSILLSRTRESLKSPIMTDHFLSEKRCVIQLGTLTVLFYLFKAGKQTGLQEQRIILHYACRRSQTR